MTLPIRLHEQQAQGEQQAEGLGSRKNQEAHGNMCEDFKVVVSGA